MNAFRVILTPEAQTDIKQLDAPLQTRILDKLAWMGQNAKYLRHHALQGKEWSGCFRYRLGDYRIIYQIDRSAEKLVILKVGHRREVYR
ncbi:MAG: type II toxin-antitoxin system RelE family toxin [Anaerolineales bacterium]